MSLEFQMILDKIKPALRPVDFESRPDYSEAVEFRKSIEPSENVSHDWVYDYGKYKFERASLVFVELDQKANEIIKYLGGGTGLLTIAALAQIRPENAFYFLCALPAFVLAITSIYFAVYARQPVEAIEPPSVKAAYRYAESFGDSAKATFVGQWHQTCQCLDVVNEKKAARVFLATWFFLFAIAFLLLPFIAIIAKMLLA
jgi:hypothetical protein